MTPSRMLTSRFGESHNALLGKGANVAMKKRKLLMLGLACALVFAVGARGDAAEEVKRLAVIDFAPRAGLEPVEGVPSNRGGHGIPQKIVIEELSAAGLQVEKIVNDWPEDSYCVLFVKR